MTWQRRAEGAISGTQPRRLRYNGGMGRRPSAPPPDLPVAPEVAAALLHVSVATVYRWRGTPKLAALTTEAVREALLRQRPKGKPRGRPFPGKG